MGKIFSSHSAPRSYSEKPRDLHGQFNARQLALYRSRSDRHVNTLDQLSSSRFQDRHVDDAPWTPSPTSKKMIAIFFMTLVAMNEGIHIMNTRPICASRENKNHSFNQKMSKTDAREVLNISPNASDSAIHKAHHKRIAQFIDIGAQAMGALAFGPLGGILLAPRPAQAFDIPSFSERAERASEAFQDALYPTSGKPLLYGKFDAAAEGFEKAATMYTQFHEEHPVLAEFALSAATASAKGLVCAAQAAPAGAALGGIVGAPFGPAAALAGAAEGALYMASRGFLVCAQAAVAQDALGRGVHAVAGEQLDAFMRSAIDTMTPYLEKIDPRLAETGRGRMFSAGLLVGVSSAADITLGTSGLLKAVNRGPFNINDMTDAFVRGGLLTTAEVAETIAANVEHGIPGALQELAFHRAINFGSQAMAHPEQTAFSHDPNHDLGRPGNFFTQTETREAFRKQLTFASSQAQEEAVGFVAKSSRELLEKGLTINQKLGGLLDKSEKSISFQEMHKAIEDTVETFNYQEVRNTVRTFSGIASDWALLNGNPQLANKIQRYTQAGVKMWDAIDGIMNSNAAGSIAAAGASGAASGSALGPYGTLIGAAVSVAATLFSPEQEDQTIVALNRWGKLFLNSCPKVFRAYMKI